MDDQKRDELITKIDTNVDWLIKIVGNHLQHHQKLLYWVLGITTTVIMALASTIFLLLTK